MPPAAPANAGADNSAKHDARNLKRKDAAAAQKAAAEALAAKGGGRGRHKGTGGQTPQSESSTGPSHRSTSNIVGAHSPPDGKPSFCIKFQEKKNKRCHRSANDCRFSHTCCPYDVYVLGCNALKADEIMTKEELQHTIEQLEAAVRNKLQDEQRCCLQLHGKESRRTKR